MNIRTSIVLTSLFALSLSAVPASMVFTNYPEGFLTTSGAPSAEGYLWDLVATRKLTPNFSQYPIEKRMEYLKAYLSTVDNISYAKPRRITSAQYLETIPFDEIQKLCPEEREQALQQHWHQYYDSGKTYKNNLDSDKYTKDYIRTLDHLLGWTFLSDLDLYRTHAAFSTLMTTFGAYAILTSYVYSPLEVILKLLFLGVWSYTGAKFIQNDVNTIKQIKEIGKLAVEVLRQAKSNILINPSSPCMSRNSIAALEEIDKLSNSIKRNILNKKECKGDETL